MVLDSVLDDIEIESNNLVGLPLGDSSQDVQLPRCERIVGGMLGELLSDFRRDAASTQR